MAIAFVDSIASVNLGVNGGATGNLDTSGSTLLVMAVSYFIAGSMSDSEGNSWTLLHEERQGTVSLAWWYCIDPVTSVTHTFTYSGSNTYPSVIASGYSGVGPIFDQKSFASSVATSQAPGSLTPANADSLIISVEGHEIEESQSVTESLTIRENNIRVAGFQDGLALGDIVQGAAAAINPSWSSAANNNRLAAQAVFYQPPPITDRIPVIMGGDWIQQIQSPDVLKDVVYSGSDFSTDNALVRVHGTSENNVQESTAIVDDNGVLTVNQDASLETSGAHLVGFQIKDSAGSVAFEISAQTFASGNIGLGLNCLEAITSGVFNFCFGAEAGKLLDTGHTNVIIGNNTGKNLADGNNNVFIGAAAGGDTVSAIRNVCIGVSAGDKNIDGDENVAIGKSALQIGTSVEQNVAIGYLALYNTNEDGNVGVGVNAGRTNTAGSFNTFIGATTGFHASQKNNAYKSIAIGSEAYTTAHYQCVLGDSDITQTILRGDVFTGDGAYETLKRVTKTSDDSITTETFVKVDATSGDVTITLPAAADLVDTPVHLKKIDSSANAMIIEGNGVETIDDQLNVQTAVQYTCITVVSDGTEWWVL